MPDVTNLYSLSSFCSMQDISLYLNSVYYSVTATGKVIFHAEIYS